MVVVSALVCYYSPVRRWTWVISTLVFLSACGHKNVRVKAPQPSSISSGDLEGLASYYAEPYDGRKTASGEIFDSYQQLTAAHRTLPFNTMVRVTNKTNGREVDVRINDRGPFVKGRVIDLSVRAAREIDLVGPGVAPVKLKVLKEGEFAKSIPAPPPPLVAFAVQVGAFENQEKADELRKLLEKKYPSVTVQAFSAEKTIYRVRIGEPDMETANKIVAELRKHDLKPFVVRLNGE
jgi:rare lipoprotein A